MASRKRDSNEGIFEKQTSYIKPKLLIITLASKVFQENFVNYSENYYRHELSYDAINKGVEIRLNPFSGSLVNPVTNCEQITKATKTVLDRCRNSTNLKLVFATHSFYCWFFSNRISTEDACYPAVASFVYDLETDYNTIVTDIILDGCHTACEIYDEELRQRKDRENEYIMRGELDLTDRYGLENKCPTRKLSTHFPDKRVYGFVGNSVVKGVVIHGENSRKTFMSSQDNCVAFRCGNVVKGVCFGSLPHETNSGIIQHTKRSCIILEDALDTANRPLVRTKSFSKLDLNLNNV